MHFDRSREAARLDAFTTENRALIDEIEAALRSAGTPDHALDDLVTDAAENIDPDDADAVSQWASDAISNQGFEQQIAFILQENSIRDGRAMIDTAAAEARNLPKP